MEDKLGKVLIVDDDVHINELIDMYLKRGGYITKKCFNGNDACNIVSTENIGLVILDVITLNPNSGVSLKCDGEKWIYEQLNSESLYMLSLSNGMVGSEVHNLTQIFNSTNNFNNLSENYRSFLTVSPNQPSLDHSKLQVSEFILNGSKYEYTSTINGIGYFRFELSNSQNIQHFVL